MAISLCQGKNIWFSSFSLLLCELSLSSEIPLWRRAHNASNECHHFLDRGFLFTFQRDFLEGTDECSLNARKELGFVSQLSSRCSTVKTAKLLKVPTLFSTYLMDDAFT